MSGSDLGELEAGVVVSALTVPVPLAAVPAEQIVSGSPSTGDTTMGDATSTADDSTGMTTEVGTTEPQVPCGNKALDPGEECDDGDIVDGDGCSKECKFEHRYVFITSGS